MRKILIIAWKDTYLRFTDRSQVLIMLVTPLILSTIIGLAFGGSSDGGATTFSDIPLAIVNLDAGATVNGDEMNYGNLFTDIFIPPDDETANSVIGDTSQCGDNGDNTGSNTSLQDLFRTSMVDSAEIARAGVDTGDYAAAIIIPMDFTQNFAPTFGADGLTITGTAIEVYANDGKPISAGIARSVATGILEQFVTGNVTTTVTFNKLFDRAGEDGDVAAPVLYGMLNGALNLDVNCAFVSTAGTVTIDQTPVNNDNDISAFVFIVVMIGSAQSIFSALFTAEFGVLDIYNEQEAGTLPRMIVSPTTRAQILFGKLAGVLISVLLQIVLLMVALTLVASMVEGEMLFIWGDNLVMLALVVITLVLSVCGVAVLLVGIAQTAEQARTVGPLLNVVLGALGGAFGFVLPDSVSMFSPIYWARDALAELASGRSDIWLNIGVLAVLGIVMSIIGLWLFNRRVEI